MLRMTLVKNIVRVNYYRDSVQLLHFSQQARQIEGIIDAAVVMATSTNKELLARQNLLSQDGKDAAADDMIIAVSAESMSAIDNGVRRIEGLFKTSAQPREVRFHSIDEAIRSLPEANLAVISIPGEYARELVLSALDRGLNVHLFSDHVSPDVELEIKQYAKSKGLLVMGPGAGSAIIRGKAVGFANAVRKGNVGIVAAAGTGLQEVSVLVNDVGLGVSEALGVGGGDVKEKIGGISMFQGIEALAKDKETGMVVIVSKPPDQQVRTRILDYVCTSVSKPVVACFLGSEDCEVPVTVRNRVRLTRTLHATVREIVGLSKSTSDSKSISMDPARLQSVAKENWKDLGQSQRYLRGLFTGGTLAYEALIILDCLVGDVYSNAPLKSELKLLNSYSSYKDSIIDLGEEEFTAGRPHPMIDPTLRNMRLLADAKDPEVALIMLDIMLGYGSNPNPAGAMIDSIRKAQQVARDSGRVLPILAHVCGTNQDPQNRTDQETKLVDVGVRVFPTNALMVAAAALISRRGEIRFPLKGFYEKYLGEF
jgi:FdrA protein